MLIVASAGPRHARRHLQGACTGRPAGQTASLRAAACASIGMFVCRGAAAHSRNGVLMLKRLADAVDVLLALALPLMVIGTWFALAH